MKSGKSILSEQVTRLVHQVLATCGVFIHATRLCALTATVHALLSCGTLTLTGLGRAMPGKALVKHKIKRVDRLLGNGKLHGELPLIYAALAKRLIRSVEPWILIDWTKTVDGFHALVAAIPVVGRALPIYLEVHPESELGNRRVQRNFLKHLAAALPPECRPILVLDAGFGSHFRKEITKTMGWNFVVRIRGIVHAKAQNDEQWVNATSLYSGATSTPDDLGYWHLCRTGDTGLCRLVRVKKRSKGDHRWHKKPRSGVQKSAMGAAKEPWLLATSLQAEDASAVVAIYSMRMKIEETFRDIKNHRFGWSLRHAKCSSSKRIETLLLVATLAFFAVTLVGMCGETAGASRAYQANTITHRRVLSHFFLGTLLVQQDDLSWFTSHDLRCTIVQLADIVTEMCRHAGDVNTE